MSFNLSLSGGGRGSESNRSKMTWWGMDPKAFEMSSQVMDRSFFLLLASSTAAWRSWVCSWIPRTPGRNPFCSGEIQWRSTATDASLWLMIPEKILYNVERSDIGRKLLISAVSPFLCIRIVFDDFHASGIPRAHTWEYILANRRPFGSRALRWRYSRPSGPGDVLEARESLSWISFSVGGELRSMT